MTISMSIIQKMCVHGKSLQFCPAFCDAMDCSLPDCPWYSPGKNTGVGCQALLQWIFTTQGLNPCLKSIALASRFFNISTTWEALLKRREMINFGMNVEKREYLCTVGGTVNWYSYCGKWYWSSTKN